MQEEPNKYVKELTQEKYKYGFTTEVQIGRASCRERV